MPQMGFEPTIPVFKRAKAVHALDRAATVIGYSLPSIMHFRKFHPSTSLHFATRMRTWRVARLYRVLTSEIALSRKQFGMGHTYICTFFA
jgi:hypothetical protein